jgi:hypothetical protein
MTDRFYVGATDVETIGCITSFDGIFSEGPYGGDLLEFDWVAGALWVQGPKRTYTFDVPLSLSGPTYADTQAALTTIKTWRGTPLTLTRKYTSGVTAKVETCSAVLVSELNPTLQLLRFGLVPLLFQNLSGTWT